LVRDCNCKSPIQQVRRNWQGVISRPSSP
jgi:hypothetical protein